MIMTATATESDSKSFAAQSIASDSFRWDGQRWQAQTMSMSPDAMRRHLARAFPLWADDALALSGGGTFTVHATKAAGGDKRYTVVSHDGRSRLYRQAPDAYTIELGKAVR